MSFANLKIGHRVAAGFALLLLLLLITAAIARVQMAAMETSLQASRNSMRDTVALANAQDALWRLRYGISQFIAIPDPASRQRIIDESPAQDQVVKSALSRFMAESHSADELAAARSTLENYNKYIGARPRWLELYGSGKIQEASDWRNQTILPFGADTVKSFTDLIELQNKASEANFASTEKEFERTRDMVLVFVVLAALVAIAIAWNIMRTIGRRTDAASDYLSQLAAGNLDIDVRMDVQDEISKILQSVTQLHGKLVRDLEEARRSDELKALIGQIQTSSVQVGNAIAEVAATAREQEATTVEMSATTTELSASSKEISANARELVKTMTDVSSVAEQTADLATGGQNGLAHMEDTMRQVMEAAGTINAKLAILNDKASNITQVTTTINRVADQTNLLSLNAAIEAEKAGEFGRGFAVVATEIRRLADQTAVATYDIELMVKEIQSAVSASVMGMDKFSEEVRRGLQEVQKISGNLTQVIEHVKNLAPRFETVNEGMQSQASSAQQITDSLAQLNEAVQQTVESLRQSTQAIGEVNQAMHDLTGSASRHHMA